MRNNVININDVHSRLRREYHSLKELEIPRRLKAYDNGRKKRGIKESAIYAIPFPVRSLAGNNWIVFIQKSPSVKNYAGKESASVLVVSYYYSEKGISAFYLTETDIIVGFNPHFFERYNERMQLNLEHPLDIVKAFFRKGIYCKQATIKVDGKKQLIAFRIDGFQLGHYYVKDEYIEWRTFVSKDLALPNQERLKQKLMCRHFTKLNRQNTVLPNN